MMGARQGDSQAGRSERYGTKSRPVPHYAEKRDAPVRIHAGRRAAAQAGGRARRRGRGGGVHAAAVSAEADRAGRLARRRVSAGGARRVGHLGGVAGRAHGRAERGGVQLLPPAPGRPVHDPRLRELGRPDRVRPRRRAGQLDRGGDACAYARGRGAPARGRSRRGDGAAVAARQQPRAGVADRRGQARAGAGAALGRDRDGGGRRRRAPGRVPAARRHPSAGDAAGRRGHARGEPAPAAGARGARPWRRCSARRWSARRC